MSKIKVVWLCHLSNKEIQNILNPHKTINERAPWMFISLGVAESDERFEIPVVAPHEYIGKNVEIKLRGVYYHFYNPYIPFWGRHWPSFFKWDYISDYRRSKTIVSKIINKIHPDVIHLFGAENPYYSSTILQFVKVYPTILTVQGFISHTTIRKSKSLLHRIAIEQEIIRNIPIAFYVTQKQAEAIMEYNNNIELMKFSYGSYEIPEANKEGVFDYDIVFFARICQDKGIIDLLKAVQLIKQRIPEVSLCVIGGGNHSEYEKMCNDWGISSNVKWMGFLPTREDVHAQASRCKVSVLPTYHDIIPGTIIESMFLGIPVVTYNTDSIPEINAEGEAIKIVGKGDINSLSNTIIEILQNNNLRSNLREKGIKRAKEMFAPTKAYTANQWIRGYERAIELFNKQINVI